MRTATIAATILGVLAISTPSAAEEHVVIQSGKQFSVSTIQVSEGDSVVFRNEDQVIHNVFAASGTNTFEIKAQLPGQSTPVRFGAAGTTEIRCAIHPNMKLIVEVTKPAP